MRLGLVAALVLVVLSALVMLTARTLVTWFRSTPSPQLEWVYMPVGVPMNSPFAAWYALRLPEPTPRAWVQLRICGGDGSCVLGARNAVESNATGGLVTASRNLPPGTYTLDLLVVSDNKLGVARTVALASSEVKYGK